RWTGATAARHRLFDTRAPRQIGLESSRSVVNAEATCLAQHLGFPREAAEKSKHHPEEGKPQSRLNKAKQKSRNQSENQDRPGPAAYQEEGGGEDSRANDAIAKEKRSIT